MDSQILNENRSTDSKVLKRRGRHGHFICLLLKEEGSIVRFHGTEILWMLTARLMF
jgi:hypothetical protein